MSLDKLEESLEDMGFLRLKNDLVWKKGEIVVNVTGSILFVSNEGIMVSFNIDDFEFEYEPGMLTIFKKGVSCMTLLV